MAIVEIRHFHLFGALGGGARGFNKGQARVGRMQARARCIGSVDVDVGANRDFLRRVGVEATTMDLFDRAQYIDFHGHVPPPGWLEVTPDDIRRAAGGEFPHIVFLSAPCKGFSGLLSEGRSKTAKYQALNRLTLRGVWLMLEAFKDNLPELILFENVPRIANRGRALLDQIVAMLRAYGYAVRETTHDCGELGGLAQSRKRFLLVARHIEKVPAFLYEPQRRPLQSVGSVLGRMLLPGDLRAGPMHRIPNLQWKTWVRLAFVEAGGDWRTLNKLAIEDGKLRDYLLVPEMHHGAYGVQPWEEPGGVVRGASRPANGRFAVADPRSPDGRGDFLGVRDWDQHARAVTANGRPGAGAFSVADPRTAKSESWHRGQNYGVRRWEDTAGAVAGQQYPNQGNYSIADPRMPETDFKGMRVVPWARSAGVVNGGRAPGSSAQSVADPRTGLKHNNCFRVIRYDEHAGAITAGAGPSAGGQAVADPRPGWDRHSNNLTVMDWEKHSKAVIAGGKGVQGGWMSVADPRGGAADPKKLFGKYHVADWQGQARTVISGDDNGAYAIADPRSGLDRDKGDAYLSGGHYGVVPWDDHAGAVSSSASHDNGNFSVADPRAMPAPDEKTIAVIISEDGTWHRPFTTLELAALQSLIDPEEQLVLDGMSDSAWRERIGNAVPEKAATAIADEMFRTLLLAWSGETMDIGLTPIWVRPLTAAISLPGEA